MRLPSKLPPPPRLQPHAGWLALPLAVAAAGSLAWQAWMLRRAIDNGRRLARRARAFEVHPPRCNARVLVLGDSTGVGVGADQPEHSLCGLLATEFPGVQIVNRCANGARLADALAQLAPLVAAGERFDLALVFVGGNDVLKLTPGHRLAQQARRLLGGLQTVARRTVWLGSANIGSAPVFVPPLSWLLGWQTARTMRMLAREAQAAGAEFIDFVHHSGGEMFARDTATYFARDGVHPSNASYRHCFEVLKRRAPLVALLARRPVPVKPRVPYPTLPLKELHHAQRL